VATDVSANGAHALTAQGDQVRVWDASGHQLEVLAPGAPVNGAVFSPDGTKIATAGTNPPGNTGPAVWDVGTGLRLFPLHDNFGVFNAAFSHSGRQLVTAGIAGTVTVWNVGTGSGTPVQGGPVGAADHAVFSPDDRLVAVAGYDGTTRIFDVRSGIAVAVLQGSLLPLFTVEFGSSDSPLVTVDNSGALRVFACDVCGTTKQVMQAAGSIVTRSLTSAERLTYLPSG
jgi:WD40 repeat protein